MEQRTRGVFTSEFYIILIPMLTALATHVGWIGPDEAQQINEQGTETVNSLWEFAATTIAEFNALRGAILGSGVWAVSRTWLKAQS